MSENAKPEDEFSKLLSQTNDLPPLPDTAPSMADLNAMLEAQNELFKTLPSEAQNLDNFQQMLNADAANLKIEGEATRLQNAQPRLSRRYAVQLARLDAGVLSPEDSGYIGRAMAKVVVDDFQEQEAEPQAQWFKAQDLADCVAANAKYLHTRLIRHPSEVFDAEYPHLTQAHWKQIADCLEQSELAVLYACAVLDNGAK